MGNSIMEPGGFRVTVDRVLYQPQVSTPENPYCFVYFITIHNDTETPITIKGRKWVVSNATGVITALEGEGVIGQTPTIQPGDSFTYNSYHMVDTRTAAAEGSYLGLTEEGEKVLARIPKFMMVVPENGHR